MYDLGLQNLFRGSPPGMSRALFVPERRSSFDLISKQFSSSSKQRIELKNERSDTSATIYPYSTKVSAA